MNPAPSSYSSRRLRERDERPRSRTPTRTGRSANGAGAQSSAPASRSSRTPVTRDDLRKYGRTREHREEGTSKPSRGRHNTSSTPIQPHRRNLGSPPSRDRDCTNRHAALVANRTPIRHHGGSTPTGFCMTPRMRMSFTPKSKVGPMTPTFKYWTSGASPLPKAGTKQRRPPAGLAAGLSANVQQPAGSQRPRGLAAVFNKAPRGEATPAAKKAQKKEKRRKKLGAFEDTAQQALEAEEEEEMVRDEEYWKKLTKKHGGQEIELKKGEEKPGKKLSPGNRANPILPIKDLCKVTPTEKEDFLQKVEEKKLREKNILLRERKEVFGGASSSSARPKTPEAKIEEDLVQRRRSIQKGNTNNESELSLTSPRLKTTAHSSPSGSPAVKRKISPRSQKRGSPILPNENKRLLSPRTKFSSPTAPVDTRSIQGSKNKSPLSTTASRGTSDSQEKAINDASFQKKARIENRSSTSKPTKKASSSQPTPPPIRSSPPPKRSKPNFDDEFGDDFFFGNDDDDFDPMDCMGEEELQENAAAYNKRDEMTMKEYELMREHENMLTITKPTEKVETQQNNEAGEKRTKNRGTKSVITDDDERRGDHVPMNNSSFGEPSSAEGAEEVKSFLKRRGHGVSSQASIIVQPSNQEEKEAKTRSNTENRTTTKPSKPAAKRKSTTKISAGHEAEDGIVDNIITAEETAAVPRKPAAKRKSIAKKPALNVIETGDIVADLDGLGTQESASAVVRKPAAKRKSIAKKPASNVGEGEELNALAASSLNTQPGEVKPTIGSKKEVKPRAKTGGAMKAKAKAKAKAQPLGDDGEPLRKTMSEEKKDRIKKMKESLASGNFTVAKDYVQKKQINAGSNLHMVAVKRRLAIKQNSSTRASRHEQYKRKSMVLQRREELIREAKAQKYFSMEAANWDVPVFSSGYKEAIKRKNTNNSGNSILCQKPFTPDEALAACGFKAFRPGQREAVESVMDGKSTLVLLSTGMGKSLCYQILSLVLRPKGLTVVVSPLVALMSDQLTRLPVGVRGAALSSHQNVDQRYQVLSAARRGDLDVLFVTPERLALWGSGANLGFRIGMVCIDEAHCISTWSHNFRPAYMRIKKFLSILGAPHVLGLTATATAKTLESVKHVLSIENTVTRSGVNAEMLDSVNRPNLSIKALFFGEVSEKLTYLTELLKTEEIRGPRRNGSVIVYCWKKWTVDTVSRGLNQRGLSTRAYHGGLTAEIRGDVQKEFMEDKVKIIVATIAFGMGIDKPDIRSVIHYDMPKSLENYVQEIGRCGRNREFIGECRVLFTEKDFMDQRHIGTGSVSAHGDAAKKLIKKLWAPDKKWGSQLFLTEKTLGAEVGCHADEVHSLLVQLELDGVIELYACVPGKVRLRFFKKKEAEIAEQDPFMGLVLEQARRYGECYSVDLMKVLDALDLKAPDFFSILENAGSQAGFTVEKENYGFVIRVEEQTDEQVAGLAVKLRNHVQQIEYATVDQIDSAYVAFRRSAEGVPLDSLLDAYFAVTEGMDVVSVLAGGDECKKRLLGKNAQSINENWEDHPQLDSLVRRITPYVARLKIDCPSRTRKAGGEDTLKYTNILLGRLGSINESREESRRYKNFTAWKAAENEPFGMVHCAVKKALMNLILSKLNA